MIVRRCLWWLPATFLLAVTLTLALPLAGTLLAARGAQRPTAPQTLATRGCESCHGPGPSSPRDTAPGLFERAPNQVEIGGRLTSIFVEPTRFQRYGDLREGLLVISLRFGREVEVGYGNAHNASSHDFRIFENTVEHVLRFGVRRAPSLRPTANPATNGPLTVDASVATATSLPPHK